MQYYKGYSSYPFGLMMAGISSKAAGTLQNKEITFQGQRFDDDLGLNWVQFKWRNHDPQIGRFIEIDPLASKYDYNSTYAFSENKVTNHIELEGLEAIRSNEYDKEGKLSKITLEKNVVVLTKKTSDKFSRRKNVSILKKNNEKIEAIKTELNLYYNGHNGDGAKNSDGVKVEFKFNLTEQSDIGREIRGKDRAKAFQAISETNSIMGQTQHSDGTEKGTTIDRPVGAAVITNDGPVGGDNFGETNGDIIKLNSNGPKGKISHEISHTLTLSDNGYDQGGILNNPPNEVNKYEVDKIISNSVLKKK